MASCGDVEETFQHLLELFEVEPIILITTQLRHPAGFPDDGRCERTHFIIIDVPEISCRWLSYERRAMSNDSIYLTPFRGLFPKKCISHQTV